VICRFRAGHAEALADLFAQVLTLCARAGLGQVGVVAIDGTKIAANASLDRNRTEDWFHQQARLMLDQAAAVDAAEDEAAAKKAAAGEGTGDRLAPPWRDRSGRKERIKAALGEIEAHDAEQDQPVREAERRAGVARGSYEQAVAERAEQAAAVRRGPGPRIDVSREGRAVAQARRLAERAEQRAARLQAVRDQAPARRANVTDPQSRVMKTRQGWIQGYNNQTAVSQDGGGVRVSV
jgi:hypothetical protein